MRFDGRVVMVTGAGSGIGAATARRFSEEGAVVVLVGRHKGSIEKVAEGLSPERTISKVADVSKLRQVEAAVAAVIKRFGALHVLVNNAGIFKGASKTRGCIVNTASVSGLGADWAAAAYNASKGAVVNLTRAMALDYGRKGVRVNAVCPSFTLTDMTTDMAKNKKLMEKFKERMPLGRAAMPADIAAVIAFLASDDARFVNGVNLPVDGGVTASNGQPDFG